MAGAVHAGVLRVIDRVRAGALPPLVMPWDIWHTVRHTDDPSPLETLFQRGARKLGIDLFEDLRARFTADAIGRMHIELPILSHYQDPKARAGQAFHELAHAVGWLTGELTAWQTDEQYALEECAAELTSCEVRARLGQLREVDVNWSATYIGHWADKGGDPRAGLEYALEQAPVRADLILEVCNGSA